jgi:hypothetical protein
MYLIFKSRKLHLGACRARSKLTPNLHPIISKVRRPPRFGINKNKNPLSPGDLMCVKAGTWVKTNLRPFRAPTSDPYLVRRAFEVIKVNFIHNILDILMCVFLAHFITALLTIFELAHKRSDIKSFVEKYFTSWGL